MRAYKGASNDFCKYTDLSVKDIWNLVRLESVELERNDLKAIVMELCTRIMNAKAAAG